MVETWYSVSPNFKFFPREISAEYGNVQGAVFNVVTRQGSNAFHGDGNFYFMNQGMTGRNTTDAQDSKLPYHRAEFKDTTWQVGGPVKKDKLWFFGSFQYQKDADSQPGTDPAFPARSSAKRIFWKVNYQVNEKNKVQVQEHDDFYDIPGRATSLTAPSTIGVATSVANMNFGCIASKAVVRPTSTPRSPNAAPS